MAVGERLDDTLIFGLEDAPVLEGFHEVVDVVYLVDLSPGEVEDDSGLVVVTSVARSSS